MYSHPPIRRAEPTSRFSPAPAGFYHPERLQRGYPVSGSGILVHSRITPSPFPAGNPFDAQSFLQRYHEYAETVPNQRNLYRNVALPGRYSAVQSPSQANVHSHSFFISPAASSSAAALQRIRGIRGKRSAGWPYPPVHGRAQYRRPPRQTLPARTGWSPGWPWP